MSLEGAGEILCDPTTVKITLLRLDLFVANETGVHWAGIDGDVTLDLLEGRGGCFVAPGCFFCGLAVEANGPVGGDAFPFAEGLASGFGKDAGEEVFFGDVVSGWV